MQPGAHHDPDQQKAPTGGDPVANGAASPPTPPAASWKPFRILQLISGTAVAVFGVVSLLSSGSPTVTAATRVSSVPPRMEASTPSFELVVTAEGSQVVLYLTDYVENAPIADAKLTLSLDERELPVVDRGGGIYTAANAGLTGPSQTAVTVSVSAGDRQDLLGGLLALPGGASVPRGGWGWSLGLPLGAWLLALGAFILGLGLANGRNGRVATLAAVVLLASAMPAASHPGHGDDSAPVAREDLESSTLPPNSPRRLPDGSLFVPKQAQFVLGIRTAMSRQGEATRVVRLVGRVSADPAASGTVQSTMPGRVELAPGGLPRVGQRVVRGEVLASIAPVINAIDRGNILQQLALIDRDLTTLKQRAEESLNSTNGDIKLTNALTAEVETLLRRRAAINRIIVDREGMQVPLRAPADGVISVANAIAGQIVEPRTTLYEIVDPERVWVEASGYDPTLLDAISGANAVTADGRSLPLSYLGHGPKLNQQAIPILFHVREPTMLPIGTPVLVLVETRDKHKGIILPPAAVVRNPAGLPIVWQHTGAERFVPLLVKVEPIDGRSVAVVAGLLDNRRVVVVGAELLSQVR